MAKTAKKWAVDHSRKAPRHAVARRVVSRLQRRTPARDAKAVKDFLRKSGKTPADNPRSPNFKITRETLVRAKNRKWIAPSGELLPKTYHDVKLFQKAKAAPGVLPKDTVELAFDSAEGTISAWAQQGWFASAVAEGQAFLGYPYLSELLLRAEYRRPCEVISTAMVKKWVKLTHTGMSKSTGEGADEVATAAQQKLDAIEAEMKRLDVRGAFEKAAFLEEGMGRSHIYLDFGDGNNPKEEIEDIGDGYDAASRGKCSKKKPLRRLKVVEATWTYPANYNATDPTDQSWYKPEQWYVMSKQLHASRLLSFIGREVPDMLKPAYSFGGLPLVQMLKPYVDNWLRTRQSVSDIVNNFSMNVLMTNMGSTLQPGGSSELFNRVDLFTVFKNNAGTMVLDKNSEDFKNIAVPLGTLDSLQAQTQEHMAAVCGIPLVFLLGIQPMGLNASSEGEIRVFYDWVLSYQELLFRKNLKRILGFIQLSLFNKVDPAIDFEFNPLWSMTEKELAELRKFEAEADGMDIDKGVISPEERRRRIISDENSRYAGLNPEDLPDLLEEETDGLVPEGGGRVTAEEVDEEEKEEPDESDEE